MIVHNRGWGPQLEDALFRNQITGHYRFTSAALVQQAAAPAVGPGPAQTPWPQAAPLHLAAARSR
jgi:hypothetical protein